MLLTILGCSPSWPNPGEALSGYLVETAGGRLLLDCGNGVVSRLRALDDRPPDAIVLSHLHPDHVADLAPIFFGTRFGPLEFDDTVVWAPPGGRVALAEMFEALFPGLTMGKFEEAMRVREYRGSEALEVAGARITFARNAHSSYSHAMRLEADGASLAYSGDTPPEPRLATLARDCDLLLCEATDVEPNVVHLTGREAAEAARDAAARRLVLTHVPAELREAVLAQARATYPAAELALPGLAFEVSPSRDRQAS